MPGALCSNVSIGTSAFLHVWDARRAGWSEEKRGWPDGRLLGSDQVRSRGARQRRASAIARIGSGGEGETKEGRAERPSRSEAQAPPAVCGAPVGDGRRWAALGDAGHLTRDAALGDPEGQPGE